MRKTRLIVSAGVLLAVLSTMSVGSVTTVSLVPIGPGEPGSASNPLIPPDTIVILVQTDAPLIALDAILTVASGPATIVGAAGPADCADYGWDPLFAADPIISGGSAEIGLGTFSLAGPGVVGYFAVHCHEVGIVEIDLTAGYSFGASFDWSFNLVEFADQLVIYVAESALLTLLAPNGGEVLYPGGTCTITWSSSTPISEILVEYSSDNGQSWNEVGTSPNTGSYEWLVPAVNSNQCLVRVSNASDAGVCDISDGPFAIGRTIRVETPSGGELLSAGDRYAITWSSIGPVTDVLIEYSSDNAQSWDYVCTVADSGLYEWLVPTVNSDQCLVRIGDASVPEVFDISDGLFTIGGVIDLEAPNGGEVLIAGDVYTVTWSSSGVTGEVLIQYSTNAGQSWNDVDVVPNSGSYEWLVPAVHSDQCVVRVQDLTDPNVSDASETTFAIQIHVVVPNVVGMAEETAVTTISSAGLTAGNITHAYSDTVPEGDVISQSPQAGASVPISSPVDMVISMGAYIPITIHVDDDGDADFNNIQAAIDDSYDGDIIIVHPGRYTGEGNRDIDFHGKAITVRSTDPNDEEVVASTIVDCIVTKADLRRGFYFHSGESSSSVLSGLTVTNGYAARGGAVQCRGSSPIITNCVFKGNTATENGAGLYNVNSHPTITHCTFVGNNQYYNGRGAGMANHGSNPVIRNCIFIGNFAIGDGGGMYNGNSNPTIVNCTFCRNSVRGGLGHGIYNGGGTGSSPMLTNCVLWGNGGAAQSHQIMEFNNPGTLIINYCCIQGWTGNLGGSGNFGEDPSFVDPARDDYHLLPDSPCINAGDPAHGADPAETDMDRDPRVIDGRVDMGADEFSPDTPIIEVSATHFDFLAALDGPNPESEILSVRNRSGGTLNWTISYDCSWLEVWPPSGQSSGEANEVTISVDVSGLDAGVHNCILTILSPHAIGSPQQVTVNLEVRPPVIGVAPAEFDFVYPVGGPNPEPQVLQVWNDDIGRLNWQITEDCNWLEVWPAWGRALGEANEVLVIISADHLDAGEYKCLLTISDNNAVNSPRTVEVDLMHLGAIRSVPTEHATIQAAIDAAHTGDTVMVADGVYTGLGNRDIDFKGKAITVRSQSGPENCVIDCNGMEAARHRGFYFHTDEDSSSVLHGFTITNAYSTNGGGIDCNNSSPTVVDCIITGNVATEFGGGIHCANSSWPRVLNCQIRDNHASRGGGIYFEFCTRPTVRNCLIADNSSDFPGGGIGCWDVWRLRVFNCTITHNQNAGVCQYAGSDSIIHNSNLYGNEGPEVYIKSGGAMARYSNIKVNGGWSSYRCFYHDPNFVDPGNTDLDQRDYHLLPDSVCIGRGDSEYSPGSDETDIDGDQRVIGGRLDIGADEFNPETPILGTSATELAFSTPVGGPNPEPQTLCIYNRSGGILDWEMTFDCNWLDVWPVAQQSPGEVNEVIVSVDANGLEGGQYSCVLTVSDPNAIASPRYVTVNFHVRGPVIGAMPSEMYFVSSLSEPSPEPQVLSVWNDDIHILNWEITEDCDWLDVWPSSGESSGEIDEVIISIDAYGLGPGEYECLVTISDPCALNSPITVHVSLIVGAMLFVPAQYSTIQAAIDAAREGDTVIVADGVYRGDGNRDIDFRGKAITVKSENGPMLTIIDCNAGEVDPHCGFIFQSGEDRASVLDGFTITGGYAEEGAAICGGGATIARCIITNNCAKRGGGGLAYCSGPIANCLVSRNSTEARGKGGGLWSCNGPISNCTIVDNTSYETGGGLYRCRGSIRNCIVWRNAPDQLSDCSEPTYSCIEGGSSGEGNIDAFPTFVDMNNNDYHLLGGSPCIDAGDPDYLPALDETDIDGHPRVIGAGVDMGSDECATELRMRFTPQVLNPESKGNLVKAHLVLPEDFGAGDVDTDSPVKIVEPFELGGQYMNVFVNEDGLVEIEVAFSRGEFCEAGTSDEVVEVMVVGSFTSGQYFYGTDTIKIINKTWEQIAALASYWLVEGCGKPDWCGGVDLDQDGAVDFVDYALFDGCCIEVIR